MTHRKGVRRLVVQPRDVLQLVDASVNNRKRDLRHRHGDSDLLVGARRAERENVAGQDLLRSPLVVGHVGRVHIAVAGCIRPGHVTADRLSIDGTYPQPRSQIEQYRLVALHLLLVGIGGGVAAHRTDTGGLLCRCAQVVGVSRDQQFGEGRQHRGVGGQVPVRLLDIERVYLGISLFKKSQFVGNPSISAVAVGVCLAIL